MKVLILDDDAKLAKLVVDYLRNNGASARAALNADEFESLMRQDAPDVAVLDVMLPEKDGLQVLRDLRQKGAPLPVLILSARGELADRVLGLESGADDYLAKPFQPRELLARLRALSRRGQPASTGTTRHGSLVLDHGRRQAVVEGQDMDLSVYEFAALAALAGAGGRILSRAHLAERLRGLDHDANDRSLDVMVSRLRQKLGDDARNPRFIKSVYGAGYLFLEQSE